MHGLVTPLVVTFFGLISMVGLPAFSFAPPGGPEADSPQPTPLDEAQAMLESGNAISAMAQLVRHLGDDPDNADAWLLLGRAYRALGQTEDADTAFARALDIAPDHRGALLAQGEHYLATDRPAEAETNLSRLTTLCGGTSDEAADLARALTQA